MMITGETDLKAQKNKRGTTTASRIDTKHEVPDDDGKMENRSFNSIAPLSGTRGLFTN